MKGKYYVNAHYFVIVSFQSLGKASRWIPERLLIFVKLFFIWIFFPQTNRNLPFLAVLHLYSYGACWNLHHKVRSLCEEHQHKRRCHPHSLNHQWNARISAWSWYWDSIPCSPQRTILPAPGRAMRTAPHGLKEEPVKDKCWMLDDNRVEACWNEKY